MKYAGLIILVLCISCQKNQTPKTLPDLDAIGSKCDSLRTVGANREAAKVYFETGQILKSSELFVYAAWQFRKAKLPDSALIAIDRSIDFGMSNPNILMEYELDQVNKTSLVGEKVIQRLDSIKQVQNRIENFELVSEPLDSFWSYYDKALMDTANAKHYLKQYVLNGSNATKDYYHKRYENVDKMFDQMIRRTPKHYEYARQFLSKNKIDSFENDIKGMIKQFSELYPSATYPKVYLVPGVLNGNGTLTQIGLFAAAEMFVKSDAMPNENLSPWQLKTISEPDLMIFVVFHEWLHFQQSYHDKKNEGTLLHKIIEEGACDFIVGLFSDKSVIDVSRLKKVEYLDIQENLDFILSEFKRDMYSNDLSKWMYNGGGIKDRPSDIGYALGHKICKSYYDRNNDKKEAIWQLLNTKNLENILVESDYKYLLE